MKQLKLLNTFSHVSVARNGAPLSCRVAHTSRGQAHQTHAVLEFGLSVKLEQSDVVVQGLAVVIVMYVGRGDSQRLGTRTSVLTRQIDVADPHVNGVTRSYDTNS